MKLFSTLIILLFTFMSTFAQNVSINLLTDNSGLVNIGGTVFLSVTINNTDQNISVPSYKLRPQISVPVSVASIPVTGHVLPSGWTITSNNGTVIRLSNGTSNIPPNSFETLLIAVQGNVLGGPSTISGNLLFSNGVAPGSASGPGLPGDLTADNSSTTTVEVVNPVPVALTNFNAAVKDCQPVLNWTTENEINSDRFEIERADQYASNWILAGNKIASGNSSSKVKYSFIDNNIAVSSGKVFYRLKIINKDGGYKYSEVLPVFINCKATQVNVFPNPVHNGNLYVSVTGTNKKTTAVLLSLSGQVVMKMSLTNGTNTFNVKNITNGEYVLSVKTEEGISKKVQVLIQH